MGVLDDKKDMYCGNDVLKNSMFYKDNYCHINFNDIMTAFSTLFELMIVNNWHVIAEGHTLVAGKSARIFFISFHFVCVIIVLNIFTSFVIEAFLLEYNQSRSNPSVTSPAIEKIIKAGLDFNYNVPNENVAIQEFRLDNNDAENHKNSKCSTSESTFEWEAAIASGRKHRRNCETNDSALKTSIRFHITKRKMTIQEMLEKMSEQ